ncbi:hypothetical protein niasHS_002729 [Heterodera schachtii]|uniref:Uncharacterized protein n=1 Tax=Heterodera schachtii TaxID=97005 RepID=A0ABD2K2V7_HETSC
MFFLCPTFLAFDNEIKAYKKGEMNELQRWSTEEEEEMWQSGEENGEMPKTKSRSVAPIQSLWEDGPISPIDQRTINELPRDDGRGTMVDVDIVKGRKGLWMRQNVVNLVDEIRDDGEGMATPLAMLSPALSLVPKRRRRIGTTDGRQTKKKPIRKEEKMAKLSEPKEMPKNDGIGLNVQSDFVEKSGGEEAKITNTETEGEGERTTEKKEKKKEEEKEKEEKEKEKNEIRGKEREEKEKTKEREEKEREGKGKENEKEEEKDWTMKQGKSNSKSQSQSQNSTQTETVKRDFWANALRTLLIEFRRMHPELIRGGKAKRRTTEQSSNRTKSKTNEEMARESPGGRGEPNQ